jgi:hypothetical protein
MPRFVEPTAVQARAAIAVQARAAIAVHAPAAGLAPTGTDDPRPAAAEAVTNARVHGQPPVRVGFGRPPAASLLAIADRVPGPADPYAGLVPVAGVTSGGPDPWLAHPLCTPGPDGVTAGVREV